ncbi:hypothetical protein BSK56_25970 [Paenibacillus borealis]|uniref:Uncharacterized protein n=1 Tax=Paenibacillus borealis TaxID=160799 RepID=A0ABX3H395_PAEBO|nr:hypothetical protein BSK56_25970 [Paenibacillus borealis]
MGYFSGKVYDSGWRLFHPASGNTAVVPERLSWKLSFVGFSHKCASLIRLSPHPIIIASA